jgi:arsenite/tail-anchored protein-transporting ATPase
MNFLQQPPRFLFFTGKGGVGKTSIACATALQLAEAGKRVLLVSTDPASNIGQVFDVVIGNHITAVPRVPNLSALEIDPEAAAQSYRDRLVGPVRGVLPDAVVRSIEEQLSGACTTEIAAFDEFTGLLVDSAQTAAFHHVIFDTAPTGHTIRLLQLPGAWSGFLESGKGDASCLGPLAGLEKNRSQYAAAVKALADASSTRLVLVARAQRSALREAERTRSELGNLGFARQYLVINGVYPQSGIAGDELAQALVNREQGALAQMPAGLAALPRDLIALKPFNLVGLESLRMLFRDVPGIVLSAPMATPAPAVSGTQSLAALVEQIAADGHGLVMVMGKGGVGKTTLAAAIAVSLAKRGMPVHLRIRRHIWQPRWRGRLITSMSVASIRMRNPSDTGSMSCRPKAPSWMPPKERCSKRTCARLARRRLRYFRHSLESSARLAASSSSWIRRPRDIHCCCSMRQEPTIATWCDRWTHPACTTRLR